MLGLDGQMYAKGMWAQLQAAAKAGAGECAYSGTSVIEAHRSDVDIPCLTFCPFSANNKRPAPKKSEGGSKKRKSSTGAVCRLNCADNLQCSNLGLRLLTCRPYPCVQALAAGKSEGDDRATTPAGEGSASAAAQRDPPAKEKPRVRPITHTRDPYRHAHGI
jgi:hypothetical protein